MSGKATTELARIKQDIENDMKKLRKVRDDIDKDLTGMGSDRCISSINHSLKQYKKAIEWLDKLKSVAKKIDEENSNSSGGYGGGGGSRGGFGGGGGSGHGF